MFDRLKDFLARHVFHPSIGMSFGSWWDLLRRHQFAIDLKQQPRAWIQTGFSVANSVNARIERGIYGRRIEETIVRAPIFILGHYRSGTTHPHSLLAQDPELAAPTLYQVLNPLTSLITERMSQPLANRLVIRHRFQDNMAQDAGVPSEDEIALGTMTSLSPYLAYYFPRDAACYDRYLTFDGVSASDVTQWGKALTTFAKKLTLRHGRRLILKSPPHTARIRLLLDLFPDARFVHIHRHPFEVYASTGHMTRAIQPAIQLHGCRPLDSPERILRIYAEMYSAYFDQRDLIPKDRLCDLSFNDLQRDPISSVEAIYKSLGLTGFDQVQPRLQSYLSSIAGYRKNRYEELPEPLRQRIADEWARSFAEWGYER